MSLLLACSDDDADGIPDRNDACPGFLDTLDADSDTIPDACDATPHNDDDGDGVLDDVDRCVGDDRIDSDLDSVPDACDPCPVDRRDDRDGDGVCDSDDVCPEYRNDADDRDGDGIPDPCDVCPNEADSDGDGVCESVDRCAGSDDHVDQDDDGLPDGCDPCPVGDDSDGDGVCNGVDRCPGFDDVGACPYFGIDCRLDLEGRVPESGAIDLGPAVAFAPLCSGEVLVASATDPTIDRWDVVTREIVASYPTADIPRGMVVDRLSRSIYVALANGIQRLDADGASTAMYTATALIYGMAAGDGDAMFVVEDHSTNGNELVILDATTLQPRQRVLLRAYYEQVAFDAVHGRLVFSGHDASLHWNAARYQYDGIAQTVTLEEAVVLPDPYTRPLTLSPDGETVVGYCENDAMPELLTSDLRARVGSYGLCGSALAYDPTGARFAAVAYSGGATFDVATNDTITTFPTPEFDDPRIGWSMGGTRLFVLAWNWVEGTARMRWVRP